MKLRVYDGVAVACFLMLPALFTTQLSVLAGQNGSAGWLALLVAFVAMAALFLLCTRLMARYPGKGLPHIAAGVLGRPLAALFGLILGAYLCLYTGVHIRESAEILKIYGLKLTPLWAVAGLMLLCAVVLCGFGGRAIIKSAGFFFILMLAGLVFVLLLGLTRYNVHHLAPVWGPGLPQVLKNGLLTVSLFDGVLFLLLQAPALGSTGQLAKTGVLALAVSAAAFILLLLGAVCMFSPQVAAQMMSAYMEMGKSSYFNHFFYRFESVLLFFLIFATALQAALGLYLAGESVAGAVGLRHTRPITLLCAAGVAAACLLPTGVQGLLQVYLPILRRYSVLLVAGIPVLILAVSTVRRALGYEEN